MKFPHFLLWLTLCGQHALCQTPAPVPPGDNEAPAPVPATEPKPAEPRPEEMNPGETNPGETNPGEVKPGEVKPGETPPAEPAGPTPLTEEQTAKLAEARKAVIIVTGDLGSGTAFLCDLPDGRTVYVTNAHVLSGNTKMTITDASGAPVKMKIETLQAATGQDLACMMPRTGPPFPLEVAGKDQEIAIGDEVVCFGNSEGKGEIREMRGKILALNDRLLEVDAELVPGDSGGPVIHLASGKVIGVGTFAHLRVVKSSDIRGTTFLEVRRYCERLSATAWKPREWTSFSRDAALIQKYKQHSDEIIALFLDIADDGVISSRRYEKASVNMRASVKGFLEAMQGRADPGDRKKAAVSFLNTIEHQLRQGSFDPLEKMRDRGDAMCSFHRDELFRECALREALSEGLRNLITAQTGVSTAINRPTGDQFWRKMTQTPLPGRPELPRPPDTPVTPPPAKPGTPMPPPGTPVPPKSDDPAPTPGGEPSPSPDPKSDPPPAVKETAP